MAGFAVEREMPGGKRISEPSNADLNRGHPPRSGAPANRISEIQGVLDPARADG